MARKRKKYMVTSEASEAFACSLVTNPAVEELFVAFNEHKEIIEKLSDEKKHMVTGIVAIPNKPIYRRDDDGEEYDIVFSADAIETMAKKFMKNFRQKNVTLQHQEDADGIYMVEQWIKTDARADKSIALGFSEDIPVGTWFQTYYVDSKDVWDRIMSNELRGFSLECALSVDEIDFSAEEQTPVETPAPEPVEAPQPAETKDEKSILSKIMDLISGKPIEEVAKPVEKETEIAPEPPKVEEPTPIPEQPKEAATEQKNEEKPNPLQEVVDNLKAEIEALKKMNEGLENKIKEVGKKPSAQPINTNAKGKTEQTGVGNPNFKSWREKMKNMT